MLNILTGQFLEEAIKFPPPRPQPLVSHFLYPEACTLITGQTGKGKSIITANIALALSSGSPVFGSLAVQRPARVYYLQCEGSMIEQMHRLHLMNTSILFDPTNLCWDADKSTHLNTLDKESVEQKLEQIRCAFPAPPDVVIIDPIYKIAGGDLAKADNALALIHFSDQLMARFHCCVILVHHVHREKYTAQGKQIKENDAFYGHSFLKNHVDFSYKFTQVDRSVDRSMLKLLKRREEHVLEEIDIWYHPENYTVTILPQQEPTTKREAVEAFLRTHTTTDFYAVKDATGVSAGFLRELQSDFIAKGILHVYPSPGKRSIWKPNLNGVSVQTP